MPESGVRSTYSQAPFKIVMYDLGGPISSGTAFHYQSGESRFLVTNWHNLTGRDRFTNEVIDRVGFRTPLWIEVHTATYVPPSPSGLFGIVPHRVEIYRDISGPFDPLWHETPVSICDVVALPLPKPPWEPEFFHNAANLIGRYRVPVAPGVTAQVIGFPQGLSTGFGLPIWKPTFIASEPHYDVSIGSQKVRAFFIDGRTRPGMSGSPVFAQYTGTWDTTDPYRDVNPSEPGFRFRDDIALGFTALEFIGVYSGRVTGGAEDDAALGLCWRREVVDEACSNPNGGQNPNFAANR